MKDYSITIIQNEAVPLAANPNSIIDNTKWIILIIAILLLIILHVYLIVCRWKEQQVVTLMAKVNDNPIPYNRFNYIKMKEAERELQYLLLERESSNSNKEI